MSNHTSVLTKISARVLSVLLVATGISVPAMSSAQAVFTPMERTSANSAGWTITRQGDSTGTVAVPADERQIVLTGNYKVNPAKISPLVVGDVVMARFEVSGGDKISERGGWRWQTNQVPNFSSDRATAYPSFKVTVVNNSVGRNTYFTAAATITLNGSGSLTLTPVLYINGVRQSGTIADNFVDYAPIVQWLEYSPTYTVTAQDFEIFAQAPLCLDRTKYNGSIFGGLTSALGLKRGSTPVTGAVDSDLNYVFNSLGRTTGYNYPTPSDTFWLTTHADQIKPNDASTNVVTGDVLSMTPSLTHNVLGDVLGGCPRFTTADPVGSQGIFNMNFTTAGAEAFAQCEFEDVVTGRKVFDYKLLSTMYGVLTNCGSDGLEVGRTYRLTVRFSMYADFRPDYTGGFNNKLGMTIGIEDTLVTVGRSTFTEPTLPGSTGPGAITWASRNNETESAPVHLGRGDVFTVNATNGQTQSSSDGADGWLVSSRPAPNTIRVERWGPTGRKTFNGANYVEFTDPVPSNWISRGSSAGGLGWFDSGNKWFMLLPGFQDMWVTEGSFDSTTTRTYKITLDEMDQTCREFFDPHSFVNTEQVYMSLKVFSSMAPTPTVQIYCAGPEGNRGNRDLWQNKLYTTVDTVVDGIGTLKTGFTTNPAEEDQVWEYSTSTSAVNMKRNSAPSDIALAFLGTYWDGTGPNPGDNQMTAMNADQYSLVLVRNDGTVDEIKNIGWTPTVGHNTKSLSLSFDSNGKLRLLVTSSADTTYVGQAYWELFDISTAGVVTKMGDVTIDSDSNFTGSYPARPTPIANPNQNDISSLTLAPGVGDDTKLFARRTLGTRIGYAVINLVTMHAWTGESTPLAGFAQVGQAFDNEGAHFVYGRFADEFHYSVIRWGVGIDATAEKGITSSDEFTIEKGTTAVETATTNIEGPTWSLDGGANAALFTINPSTGALVFKTAQPVGTYVVIIKATNGTDTDTQSVSINVTDTTDPDFDVVTPIDVDLGHIDVVTPTNVTEDVTFTIGGTDGGLFNIDAETGEVTFKNPADAVDTFTIEITATDPSGNSVTKTVVINVVPDTTKPVIETAASMTIDHGDLSVMTLEANEPVTWSIDGGAHSDLFEVDPDSGALTFKATVDNGTYELIVKTVDGSGNFQHKTITITVREPGIQAPTNAKFQVQSNGDTKISWLKPTGAVNFKVKRNNKMVCETKKNFCVVSASFKRTDSVKVTAIDAQKRTATATAQFAAKVVDPVTPGSSKLKATVYFDISDWRLTKKAKSTLFSLMLKLKKGEYKSVTITAHTDNLGNLQSDSSLSRARAKNVKRYLKYYLPKLKVSFSGLGRQDPAVPNLSEALRKQNRRAEVQAYK